MAAQWDDQGVGDPAVQRRQNSLVGPGEFCKVPVGGLLWSSDPSGETGDVVVIGNENPTHPIGIFHLEQEFARLRDRRAVLLSLS